MNSGISLAISHTPWIPQRRESLRRLLDQLGSCEVTLFQDRSPNWAWSYQMWSWALQTGDRHCLFLQDDVQIAPDFWPQLREMISEAPDEIIGLESCHPAARTIAREGLGWYTTIDGLVGPGYVVPGRILADFLSWRARELMPGAALKISEDTLIGLYAMARGRRIFHPTPTIIDHDLSIKSTYGNDIHRHRRPYATWHDFDRSTLDCDASKAVHLGRFYSSNHWLCRQYVYDWTPEKHWAAELDSCPAQYAEGL